MQLIDAINYEISEKISPTIGLDPVYEMTNIPYRFHRTVKNTKTKVHVWHTGVKRTSRHDYRLKFFNDSGYEAVIRLSSSPDRITLIENEGFSNKEVANMLEWVEKFRTALIEFTQSTTSDLDELEDRMAEIDPNFEIPARTKKTRRR